MLNVSDVMTREVITVTADTSVDEVGQLMMQHRISGLPVIDDNGTVVGLVTEGDLLKRVEIGTEGRREGWLSLLLNPGRAAQAYIHSHGRKVGELMADKIVSVTPDTPLADVVAIMEARGIKRLPVIEAGRLVGIVSRADLLKGLTQLLPKASEASVTDTEILRSIVAEMQQQPWAPRTNVTPVVENGVVELRGVINDDRTREALRVIAENTPGVTSVRDHLVWIEPYSGMVIDEPAED